MTKEKLSKEQRRERLDKALDLTRKILYGIVFVAATAFIGLLITMVVLYGIDATANETFLNGGGYLFGIIGIPLFSVITVLSILIAILNLRDDLLENEEKTSEFKMTEVTK